MWRLLLARLHPDVGGDQESFMLASVLRAGVNGDPHFEPGPADGASGTEAFLRKWRGTMDSWASDNRDALRGYRLRRGRAPSR